MAFGSCLITHVVENGDGTAGSGSILFTLTGRVTNSGKTILPSTITANLDATGHLSQALIPNNDSGTIPQTTEWRVDFKLLGDKAESFYITVPTNTATADLGSLLPQDPFGG